MYRGVWWLFTCVVCKSRPRYDDDGNLLSEGVLVRFFTKKEVSNILDPDNVLCPVCSQECADMWNAIDPEWWS